jgi:hypothetical protein
MSGSWIAAGIIILPSFMNPLSYARRSTLTLVPDAFVTTAQVPRFRLVSFHGQNLDPFSMQRYLNREYQTALGFAAILAVFISNGGGWKLPQINCLHDYMVTIRP